MQLETSRMPTRPGEETLEFKYDLEKAAPDAQQVTEICLGEDRESLPILHRWLVGCLKECSRSEEGEAIPITIGTVSALPDSLASFIARGIVERLTDRGLLI
jgi:hypothetical protein